LFEKFNTKDAIVWVDPLDGTSDLIKGNFTAVTVLIGLSIGGKSRAGIVHSPFSLEDQSQGLTCFGTAEHGVFRVRYNPTMTSQESVARVIEYIPPFDYFEQPTKDHTIKVAASKIWPGRKEQIIQKISPY
jgi:3'-phosphoadenosine 5'-phosphosulfate (PAPS) 3'-phosphatase